jgi:hypothetical protein
MVKPGSDSRTDILKANELWGKYQERYNNTLNMEIFNKPEAITSENILQHMRDGYRGVANINVNNNSYQHSVVIKRIVERTVIKMNGSVTTRLIYNVMDPANTFTSISLKSILELLFIK